MLELFKSFFSIMFQFVLLLLKPIFLVPILMIALGYYYEIKKYKKCSYYKITHNPYLRVRYNVGKHGEYLTYRYLRKFEKAGAKFLFNVYIPKENEETTEIDVLMISCKGLFVFESKNYGGWIFGSDNQKYWYQTFPAGRGRSHKESFYNPIFQNNTHIKYLKSLISEQIPMHSIITFSERCTLKNVNIYNSNVYVIKRYNVRKLVSTIYNNYGDVLSDEQVNDIYNKLYSYTQVSESVKQEHIDNINNHLNKSAVELTVPDTNEENIEQNNEIDINSEIINDETIEKNEIEENIKEETKNSTQICPNCGSKLVLRKAKFGEHAGESFYGCSNYPKCKYIKKIENPISNIEIIKGDLTSMNLDIIVNAANHTLLGGGGIDGVIHRKAGSQLLEECRKLNGCEIGSAKMTDGYNLPCKKIIHACGPMYYGHEQEAPIKLKECYKKCIELADEYRIKNNLESISIGFPCISTGIYGYPKEEACKIAIDTVSEYTNKKIKVKFVCYEELDYNLYMKYFKIK